MQKLIVKFPGWYDSYFRKSQNSRFSKKLRKVKHIFFDQIRLGVEQPVLGKNWSNRDSFSKGFLLQIRRQKQKKKTNAKQSS